jgi:hypothetical protein
MSMTTFDGRPQADFSLSTVQAGAAEDLEDFMGTSLVLADAGVPIATAAKKASIR